MTKVQHAESSLYAQLLGHFSETYFVGVGKNLSNEIVLIVYMNPETTNPPPLPADWEGFRVVVKDLRSLVV